MARLRKLRVAFDHRTHDMSRKVLECRSLGHNWVRRPISPDRFLRMARDGYREEVRRCEERPDGTGGCGQTWTQVFSRVTGGLVEETRPYAKEFKVPKGTGRMPRCEARKALWAREDADLYSRR